MKFGAGRVAAFSVLTTAISLFGFSISGSFWMLCLFAAPYGFGAGSLDAALNNYVALHYGSRYMSWLHCFWGVGAVISPYIMGYYLTGGFGWATGYRVIALIQIGVVVMLFASLPLWKKRESGTPEDPTERSAPLKLSQIFRIRGVKLVIPALFGYCAVETTTALWATSYLVHHRGMSPEAVAPYAANIYLGITIGRFISGLIANKVGDRNMIRTGIAIMFAGIGMVALPSKVDWISLYGLIVIGLGCAPVFPSFIHAAPDNFGTENSKAIIGVQMAGAYTGSTFIPPLLGLLVDNISMSLYPVVLLLFTAMLLTMSEWLNRTVK